MKKIKILSFLLSAIIFFEINIINTVYVRATSKQEIQNKIDNNKNKINDLQNKNDGIKNEKSSEKNKLEDVKNKMESENTKLQKVENELLKIINNINVLQSEIDTVQSDILNVEKNIETIHKDIEKTKNREVKIRDMLAKRLRTSYKVNFSSQFIYMILESKNFGDLIGNIATIKYLIKSDNELIDSLKNLQQELERNIDTLKKEEEDLILKKDNIKNKQQILKSSKDEQSKLVSEHKMKLDELRVLEESKHAQINSLSEEEKNIEGEIARYEEDTANLQRYFNNLSTTNNNENNSTNDKPSNNSNNNQSNDINNDSQDGSKPSSTGFIKPVPGNTITSKYGPRIHPTTGKNSFHTGVDFSEPQGTPIKAAKGGKVTTATFHTAYGNMIIIDHLDGTSTLYAHSSQLLVSTGQIVTQGQVIAKVGSTGYSTGPHLHFEVRVNGQHVNPMNYL